MNNKFETHFRCLLGIVCIVLSMNTLTAQTNDSLSLKQIINQIVSSHPSIKEAEEALNMADAKIALSKAGYLPNVEGAASYTRIGPVPEIEFGGRTMQMAPGNNYTAGINYNQVVYDFGRTGKDVAVETENKNLAQQSVEQLKQKMSGAAINSFYTLVYLQEASEIKAEQMKTLNEHLEFIQKRKETGSATQFEILSTQVRISNVESQKVDIESARKVQSAILNSLMGQPAKQVIFAKKELEVQQTAIVSDSLLSYAIDHRDETKIAREREAIANLRYKYVTAQNKPTLSVFASGGFKDGYFPNLESPKLNFAAGIGLRIPIFDANRTKSNATMAKLNIQNASYEIEIAQRNISNEVIEAESNVDAAGKKISQFELQLSQASHALDLALVSYKAGTITNLEVLDATTSVSESRLLLLKSKIDHVASIFRLKAALGDRLY